MRVARMAGVLGKTCIPHISSTGLGYLYMMHFVSAIPNSSCLTSTLRSDDDGVIKVPTGPGLASRSIPLMSRSTPS